MTALSPHPPWHGLLLARTPSSLTVCTYYGDGKKKGEALKRLRELDVLITTPHMLMPQHFLENVSAHRLVTSATRASHQRSSLPFPSPLPRPSPLGPEWQAPG